MVWLGYVGVGQNNTLLAWHAYVEGQTQVHLQMIGTSLVGAVVQLAIEDTVSETSAEATAHYSGSGLPEIPKVVLQPLLLGALWLVLDGHPVLQQRFGQSAATLCIEWMMEFTHHGSESVKVDGQVLDLSPYCQVCGEWLFTSS